MYAFEITALPVSTETESHNLKRFQMISEGCTNVDKYFLAFYGIKFLDSGDFINL